jgi:hypothetical protein
MVISAPALPFEMTTKNPVVKPQGATWPREIDHINGDGCDNRLANLREVSHSENLANANKCIKNTTGFKGVSPKRGKFLACIRMHGRQYFLGYHDTREAAHAAYVEKAKELYGQSANSSDRPSHSQSAVPHTRRSQGKMARTASLLADRTKVLDK